MENQTDNVRRVHFHLGPINLDMIEDNLYLGSLGAATNISVLNTHHITHILTIDDIPLPNKITSNEQFVRMFLHLSNQPKEDLLSHFDATDLFIKEGLLKGAVLVHCGFGKSRSATLVIAYIMKKYGITYDEAFDKVKARRSIIRLNRGFIYQLMLYEKMGYTIDPKNMDYRVHRLIVAADKILRLRMLPLEFYDIIQPDPGQNETQSETNVLRCLNCRRIIATKLNLISHKYNGETCLKKYFVEPLAWMNCIENEEGNLDCPECNVKLGTFTWLTKRECDCGLKMVPIFYLAPSKVEYTDTYNPLQCVAL